jgi:hypothetical protein
MDLLLLPRRQDQRLPGIGAVGDAQKFLDKADHLATGGALIGLG